MTNECCCVTVTIRSQNVSSSFILYRRSNSYQGTATFTNFFVNGLQSG